MWLRGSFIAVGTPLVTGRSGMPAIVSAGWGRDKQFRGKNFRMGACADSGGVLARGAGGRTTEASCGWTRWVRLAGVPGVSVERIAEGGDQDVLKRVRAAFADTVTMKLRQLYVVVPQGSNPALTGAFVEELVRGFIAAGAVHPVPCPLGLISFGCNAPRRFWLPSRERKNSRNFLCRKGYRSGQSRDRTGALRIFRTGFPSSR